MLNHTLEGHREKTAQSTTSSKMTFHFWNTWIVSPPQHTVWGVSKTWFPKYTYPCLQLPGAHCPAHILQRRLWSDGWFLFVSKTVRATNRCCESLHCLKAAGYEGGLLLPSYITQYTWLPVLMEPALNTGFVHLATNLRGIVSTSTIHQRSPFHGQPHPPARTTSHSAQCHDSRFRWEEFPYLFG